ncbi:hypothetical protein SAMN05421869_11631 [Nonomuraea jiangxiensis]|uniref:Uncharacterized protein n=1 Tax=Nonomuraea jiangxiensis TaxID=633440 RepID=A0A1G9C0C9_9ACTN|nr:hypothetical protein SAMN05421869_11631 [Nonomuraea jiangxiensis]
MPLEGNHWSSIDTITRAVFADEYAVVIRRLSHHRGLMVVGRDRKPRMLGWCMRIGVPTS